MNDARLTMGLLMAGIVAAMLGAGTASAETLYEGDVQLIFTGGVELPFGQLYDLERDRTTVRRTAEYEDGTVANSEVKHTGLNWGVMGEYTLDEYFGIQAGVDYREVNQKISAGGGNYEEATYATGTLISFVRPYVGASFYLYNENFLNVALTGRAGTIVDGVLRPRITSYHYYNQAPDTATLTGATLGGGVSVSYIVQSFVIGASFFATQNFLHASKKVYDDLPEDFSVLSCDLTGYIGLRF